VPRAASIRAVAPSLPGAFRVRARLEQPLDHGRIADGRGLAERRRAVVVGGVDVGAGLDEARDEVGVVVVDGPVQRRGAVGRFRLCVGAML